MVSFNRIEQPFGRNLDPIIRLYHVDARAALPLRFPEIHHRRKVQIRVNHLIALVAESGIAATEQAPLVFRAQTREPLRVRVTQLQVGHHGLLRSLLGCALHNP